MECTIITTATGKVIEAATGYLAIKAKIETDAWVEVERVDGGMESVAAGMIIGYAQGAATKQKGRIGFA